ncbi:MAG: hypothetical protein V1821_00280 [bacterium]
MLLLIQNRSGESNASWSNHEPRETNERSLEMVQTFRRMDYHVSCGDPEIGIGPQDIDIVWRDGHGHYSGRFEIKIYVGNWYCGPGVVAELAHAVADVFDRHWKSLPDREERIKKKKECDDWLKSSENLKKELAAVLEKELFSTIDYCWKDRQRRLLSRLAEANLKLVSDVTALKHRTELTKLVGRKAAALIQEFVLNKLNLSFGSKVP